MAVLTNSFDALRTYAGSLTWSPLVRFSRGAVLGLLRRIAVGQVVVTDSDGAVIMCGSPKVKEGTPKTELRVLKETFWVRALLFADMVSDFEVVRTSSNLRAQVWGRRAERILLGIRGELHVGRDLVSGSGCLLPGTMKRRRIG